MTGPEPGTGRGRALVGVVLLLALGARLAIVVPALDRPPNDPDGYLTIARSLIDGRGFSLVGRPTAYRPPLYPLLITPLVAMFGERSAAPFLLLNVALGVATTAATMVAATRWGLSGVRILATGFIVACDPVLVVQARSVMTETLAALLVAGALMTLARGTGVRAAAWGGAWFGLASLCRPSLLASAVLTAGASMVCGPGAIRQRLARGAALIGVTLLVMSPWAARNARIFGEPVWTTTHGGYTLALANNPTYYRDVVAGRSGEVWTGPAQQAWAQSVLTRYRGLPEPEADRRLAAEGWKMARVQPSAFVRASAARLARFWGLMPARSVYGLPLRLVTLAWTLPLFLALGAGLARKGCWGWPKAAAAACLFALTLVHTFYWTDLRMRAPVVPAIALLAAGAMASRAETGGKSPPEGGRK